MKTKFETIDNLKEECHKTDSIWFNSTQAANYLKVDTFTLRNLSSNGQIPYYKLGRSNRYLKSELDRLILSNPRGERPWE